MATDIAIPPPVKEGVVSRDGSHVFGWEGNGGSIVIELHCHSLATVECKGKGKGRS